MRSLPATIRRFLPEALLVNGGWERQHSEELSKLPKGTSNTATQINKKILVFEAYNTLITPVLGLFFLFHSEQCTKSLQIDISHYYVNICNSVFKFFINLIAELVAYT